MALNLLVCIHHRAARAQVWKTLKVSLACLLLTQTLGGRSSNDERSRSQVAASTGTRGPVLSPRSIVRQAELNVHRPPTMTL